jgi:hypothetical protein
MFTPGVWVSLIEDDGNFTWPFMRDKFKDFSLQNRKDQKVAQVDGVYNWNQHG